MVIENKNIYVHFVNLICKNVIFLIVLCRNPDIEHMDLDTENRIAALLLKEAAELRCQAQKEGALAYLREPTVRSRPNSRFLTTTVRGVQQG